MGGQGSGWHGKGREGRPHSETSRAAIAKGMAKAKEEGHIAPPLQLSGFEPLTSAFLALIDWHPFLCGQCGAYKLGPSWMTVGSCCSNQDRDRLDRLASGQGELWAIQLTAT